MFKAALRLYKDKYLTHQHFFVITHLLDHRGGTLNDIDVPFIRGYDCYLLNTVNWENQSATITTRGWGEH